MTFDFADELLIELDFVGNNEEDEEDEEDEDDEEEDEDEDEDDVDDDEEADNDRFRVGDLFSILIGDNDG